MPSTTTQRLLRAWVPRFSLLRMLLVTAILALVLMAVTKPSEEAAAYAWQVLLLVVLLTLSYAAAERASARYFAIGLLVWLGILTLIPHVRPDFDEPLGIVADALNSVVYKFVFGSEFMPDRGGGLRSYIPVVGFLFYGGLDTSLLFRSEHFEDVCKPLWTIVFGLFGGWITASLYRFYNQDCGETA